MTEHPWELLYYDRLLAYLNGFRNGVLVDESDIVLWVILSSSGKFLLAYAGPLRKKLQCIINQHSINFGTH
jgi:hypothetical protein